MSEPVDTHAIIDKMFLAIEAASVGMKAACELNAFESAANAAAAAKDMALALQALGVKPRGWAMSLDRRRPFG